MSDEPVLLCSDRDGVRTLTLNRPRRKNAINRDLWIALAEALNAAGDDRGVRAVVITGHSKALLNEGADRTIRDALANEARAQVGNFATVDSAEAYAAFAEKRDASFTGQWAVPRSEQRNA
ncbi:MAG TPA: enoyl-CoA hydratase-related protein [Mycobacterium sp.]|nr:enoyl-CoA hydratase-related protein [Mycobacterium sp.]